MRVRLLRPLICGDNITICTCARTDGINSVSIKKNTTPNRKQASGIQAGFKLIESVGGSFKDMEQRASSGLGFWL
jgi:hypothetical protein